MQIRKAAQTDLDAIEESYRELLRNIPPEENYSGWVLDVYPNRAWVEENLGDMWVLMDEAGFGGSMILNHQQAADYQEIPWEIPAEPDAVMVIHTLCIPPSRAGRGYGRAMVNFAIDEAVRQKMKTLRLDTAAGNRPAAALYQSCGFALRGKRQVLHQGVIPEKLIFFEMGLSNPCKMG